MYSWHRHAPHTILAYSLHVVSRARLSNKKQYQIAKASGHTYLNLQMLSLLPSASVDSFTQAKHKLTVRAFFLRPLLSAPACCQCVRTKLLGSIICAFFCFSLQLNTIFGVCFLQSNRYRTHRTEEAAKSQNRATECLPRFSLLFPTTRNQVNSNRLSADGNVQAAAI